MKNLFKFLRMPEWYDSKVPMLLSVYLFFFIMEPEQYSFSSFVSYFFAYWLFLFMFLAFGYVINDFSDIEADKAAGKTKVIFNIRPIVVIISLIAMVVLGNIPILLITGFSISSVVVIAVIYFFGAAYSIKFLRFKEKGILGLIECSVAQKCLPLLILFFIVEVNILYFVAWILLMFLNGLRYILIHQLIDYENDIKTGIKTFLSSNMRRIDYSIYIALIIEIVCILFLFHTLILNPLGISLILLYIIYECIIFVVIEKHSQKKYFLSYEAVPLEAFFNIFLPLTLLVAIGINVPYAFILLTAMFLYILRALNIKTIPIRWFIKFKLKRLN